MQTTELLNGKRATTRVAPTCATLLLALFFCAGLRAQVTIGGLTEPVSGAILDLNSDTKGGLILSNVTITNPERIPHGTKVFQGIDAANDHNNTDLRGTMVYNDGQNPALPAGVYIWNGSCWTKNGGEVIINNPLPITVDGAVKSSVEVAEGSSTAVALAVASPQPDVSYEWYENTTASTTDGASVSTGETYTTPNNLEVKTYFYYCKATSLACPSVNAVSGVITVTVKIDPATLPALPTGSGTLAGTTCFDVAAVNNGGSCGVLSRRLSGKRVFSTSPTQTYAFSGSADGLTFDFKNLDAAHPVIESLDGSGTTVTVTFNTGLDTWARELTREQALKAELYAIYNGQATKLTLSVSDCHCCPGLLVVRGEYKQHSPNPTTSFSTTGYNQPNTTGSAAAAVMKSFNKTDYDLCYYYRDANSSGSAGSSSQYTWHNAIGSSSATGIYTNGGVCQTTEGVDAVDAHSDWRLPNEAELAQIGQLVSNNTPSGGIDVGVGSQTHVDAAISLGTSYAIDIRFPTGSNTTSTGTYNLIHSGYWSSTEYDVVTYAWFWSFGPNNRYAYGYVKTESFRVRCVRAF